MARNRSTIPRSTLSDEPARVVRGTDEDHRRELGARGEQAASEYLTRENFEVAVRNWRSKYGEIDLIAFDHSTPCRRTGTSAGAGTGCPTGGATCAPTGAREGTTLVFIEVKTRIYSPNAHRLIFQTITPRKKKKLRQLVSLFIARHYCGLTRNKGAVPPHRIDVVGVILRREDYSVASIEHLKAAV